MGVNNKEEVVAGGADQQTRFQSVLLYAPYLLLSVLILGPLLLPGFVLTMDMVFTPTLRLPDHVDNTYLFYGLLHVLNVIVPVDLLQKIILLSILLLSGIGAHRLLRQLIPHAGAAVYTGGILYMCNPFVYDRFMAGQYGVLLGYAILPWFVRSLLLFLAVPTWRRMMRLSGWVVLASIVSIHSLGFLLVITIGALVWKVRQEHLRSVAYMGLVGVALFFVASSYWLIPALLGQGRIAESLLGFGESQRQAFATIDINGLGAIGSVLGLQGFWQESRWLYILPNEIWGWGLVQVAVWVLLLVGFGHAWRAQRTASMFFLGTAAIALVLAIGWGSDWLAGHVPFFAGYREPQKFVALIALTYAYGIVWATVWMMQRIHRQVALNVIILLLIAYTPTMFWGFGGQLRAAQYPTEWSAVNTQLSADKGDGKVLFLPWHLYMSYDFAGRIIASPAPAFFDREVITSSDPELDGVSPQTYSETRAIIQNQLLPEAAMGRPIAASLQKLGIRYVLVAKQYDYESYNFLQQQDDMAIMHDSTALRLYKLNVIR